MLKIDQLSHVYPNGTRALDSVSLEVGAGHVRVAGPERRRQVDADAVRRDAPDSDLGQHPLR